MSELKRHPNEITDGLSFMSPFHKEMKLEGQQYPGQQYFYQLNGNPDLLIRQNYMQHQQQQQQTQGYIFNPQFYPQQQANGTLTQQVLSPQFLSPPQQSHLQQMAIQFLPIAQPSHQQQQQHSQQQFFQQHQQQTQNQQQLSQKQNQENSQKQELLSNSQSHSQYENLASSESGKKSGEKALINFQTFLQMTQSIGQSDLNLEFVKDLYSIKMDSFHSNKEILEIFQKILSKQGYSKQQKKNWNDSETNLLVYIILKSCALKHIDFRAVPDDIWEDISTMMVGRSAEQCKMKWLSMSKLNLQQKPWCEFEDSILIKIIKEYEQKNKQNKWSEIAVKLNQASNKNVFRQGKQCRERWNNHLDPSINRGPWGEQEEVLILKLVLKKGKRWSEISKLMKSSRTENAVKNRFNSLLKKEKPNSSSSLNSSQELKSNQDLSESEKVQILATIEKLQARINNGFSLVKASQSLRDDEIEEEEEEEEIDENDNESKTGRSTLQQQHDENDSNLEDQEEEQDENIEQSEDNQSCIIKTEENTTGNNQQQQTYSSQNSFFVNTSLFPQQKSSKSTDSIGSNPPSTNASNSCSNQLFTRFNNQSSENQPIQISSSQSVDQQLFSNQQNSQQQVFASPLKQKQLPKKSVLQSKNTLFQMVEHEAKIKSEQSIHSEHHINSASQISFGPMCGMFQPVIQEEVATNQEAISTTKPKQGAPEPCSSLSNSPQLGNQKVIESSQPENKSNSKRVSLKNPMESSIKLPSTPLLSGFKQFETKDKALPSEVTIKNYSKKLNMRREDFEEEISKSQLVYVDKNNKELFVISSAYVQQRIYQDFQRNVTVLNSLMCANQQESLGSVNVLGSQVFNNSCNSNIFGQPNTNTNNSNVMTTSSQQQQNHLNPYPSTPNAASGSFGSMQNAPPSSSSISMFLNTPPMTSSGLHLGSQQNGCGEINPALFSYYGGGGFGIPGANLAANSPSMFFFNYSNANTPSHLGLQMASQNNCISPQQRMINQMPLQQILHTQNLSVVPNGQSANTSKQNTFSQQFMGKDQLSVIKSAAMLNNQLIHSDVQDQKHQKN